MTDQEKLEAITRCARRWEMDENLGDTTERIQTVLWVATDGQEGHDWGCAHPLTMTLTEFLEARIAEDEHAVTAVVALGDPGLDGLLATGDGPVASHIARWDPARVLAECAAKRAVVDAYVDAERRVHGGPSAAGIEWNLGLRQGAWAAVCLLGLLYADHPAYREDWRP